MHTRERSTSERTLLSYMFDGEYTNLVTYCCVMTNNDKKVKSRCKDCSKPKRHFQYVVYIFTYVMHTRTGLPHVTGYMLQCLFCRNTLLTTCV